MLFPIRSSGAVGLRVNKNDLQRYFKNSVITILKRGGDVYVGDIVNKPNVELIERLCGLCKQVTHFVEPVPRKLVEAKVPRIEIQPTDTKEIKRMIDKLNIKTQSFTCNHRKQDEMFYRFEADIGKIYVSNEYKAVEAFYERIALLVSRAISDDHSLVELECRRKQRNMIMDDSDDDDEDYSVYSYSNSITLDTIIELNRKVTAVNNALIEIQSKFEALRCHKCEGILKEYEITSEIIERLRREQREADELAEILRNENDEHVADDKYDLGKFLAKHFATTERILLKDIVSKYKEVTGISKTLVEMKESICQHGWKVSNVSRVFYAVRI